MNMGLHAGMRLERVLAIGESVARRGDIVVLSLEHVFYRCSGPWTNWQLTNALAWDRSYFDSLPIVTRIGAILSADDPMLPIDILASWVGSIVAPGRYAERVQALAPIKVIWERYQSGKLRTDDFAYSVYNVDDRGDMQNNVGTEFRGAGIRATIPDHVCPETLSMLTNFVARMKDKGMRVIVAHAPYLIEGAPTAGWQTAEDNFSREISSTGATILDRRNELFLPRAYFFNTNLHLNQIGRRERTKILIADLKRLGIGATADRSDRSVGPVR